VKGLGNYSFGSTVERKPGELVMYRGKQAAVRFHGGLTYAVPAQPLRNIGVKPGDRFTMVVVRRGKKVVEIRVEPMAQARPARPRHATPKVYRRDGRKVVTRKR